MLDATAHEALWMLECHLLKPDLPLTWLQPEWPAPATVRAVMTDRHGGVSVLPYGSMNLGDHVGDAADHVAANRAELARAGQRIGAINHAGISAASRAAINEGLRTLGLP